LVAALGLIAATGPSALAQDQDTPSTQPTTPATLPATYTQPAMPGQVVSPYAPAYSGMVTPCGGVMPSAHVPGTVMYGSQFPQYQPFAANGSMPQMMMPYSQPGVQYAQPMMQYGQPAMQYAQPMMQYAQQDMQYGQSTVMPVAGSVASGVMTQPYQTGQLQLSGTTFNGMTYQPSQQGMVYSSGMPYQPSMVYQTGAMGTYSNQPVIHSGYAPSYGYAPAPAYAPGGPGYGYGGSGYGYDFGRPGYNPGGLGGPRSGLGVRPGMGFGGFGLRR
jgi:hypothetical protein